jgi:DNA polymerase I-like protein with 3'-5' exonuclease and polymerase domains
MSTTSTLGLPQVFRGTPTVVAQLDRQTRGQFGLATEDTIIEVIGDQRLVQEAARYARRQKIVGFDLETGGLNHWTDRTVLCQIGDLHRQYLIWVDTVDMSPIWEVLGDKSVAKVGSNLGYDLRQILVRVGMKCRARNVVDVQLIDQVVGCGLFSSNDEKVGATLALTSLGMTAKRWLGLDLPKDEDIRTGWEKMTPGQWWEWTIDEATGERKKKSLLRKKFYAADDVIVPLQIVERQKPWIKRLGLVETVNLEHAFLPVLAEMQVRGIQVDLDKWEKLAFEAQAELAKACRTLDHMFNVTVTYDVDVDGVGTVTRDKNYGSRIQLQDLIREYLYREHAIDAILLNKHLRESMERKGIPDARIAKLWADAAKKAEKDHNDTPNAKEKKLFGAPNGNDILPILWPAVKKYLGRETVYVPNTKSQTLKLFRVIGKTERKAVDPELPTKVGLPAELVDAILAMRKYSKALGTYGFSWRKIINPDTGRLHAEFIQAALVTGRISSKPNFMNFPADPRYRACFVPRKGCRFVGADWSQIEPRIIAEYSQEPTYMRVFWSEFPGTEGFEKWCDETVIETLDLYGEIGKLVGIIPKEYRLADIKGDNAKPDGLKGRKQAKIIVLGLGYGTGIPKFWLTLIVDTKEHHPKEFAAFLFETFWGKVKSMKATLDHFSNGQRQIRKKSPRRVFHPFLGREITYSETLGGRKRFMRPDDWKWWTTGRNHPIQGTGADIMKRAAVKFTHWCWENDIDGGLVNLIHDEKLAEIPNEWAVRAEAKLAEIMSGVGQMYCKSVPITADAYIEDFWKKD